jgi:hypothetical protein
MLEEIVRKWLGPTGLTIIVGLVIWLVQLNVGFVNMKGLLERMIAQQDIHDEAVESLVITQAKTTQILVGLERRMTKIETYTDLDDDRVESIDRKTLINDNLIRNHLENHRKGDYK